MILLIITFLIDFQLIVVCCLLLYLIDDNNNMHIYIVPYMPTEGCRGAGEVSVRRSGGSYCTRMS